MAPVDKLPRESAAPAKGPNNGPKKGPIVKRPWESPRVRTGHLFESNSLACGKNTPQMDQCVQSPSSS